MTMSHPIGNRPIALVVAMEAELRHFLDRVEPVETRA